MTPGGWSGTPTRLRDLAEHFRANFRVFEGNEWGAPAAIMFAWVEQESTWDPWATREERAFYRRYVVPQLSDRRVAREQWDRATSFGLLQMMGQTAREQGFTGRYLSQLCLPELNLYYCCRYLAEDRRSRTDGTWAGALCAYNGGLGGNRRPPYRNQHYLDSILRRVR